MCARESIVPSVDFVFFFVAILFNIRVERSILNASHSIHVNIVYGLGGLRLGMSALCLFIQYNMLNMNIIIITFLPTGFLADCATVPKRHRPMDCCIIFYFYQIELRSIHQQQQQLINKKQEHSADSPTEFIQHNRTLCYTYFFLLN